MISLPYRLTFTCVVLVLLQTATNAQDSSEAASRFLNEVNNQHVREFMDEELECDQYVFPPGDFPKIKWKNEVVVENEIGKFPLEVKFFNSNFSK